MLPSLIAINLKLLNERNFIPTIKVKQAKKYWLQNIKTEKNGKRSPETVVFHNNIKLGVDMTDQMDRKYTMKADPTDDLYTYFITSWILPECLDITKQQKKICQNKASQFN